MYVGIKNVKPLPEYKLLLIFDNDEQKVFDVAPYLDQGVFKALREVSLFNSVRVQFDSVEWPNGADLDPEEVYEKSVAEEVGKVAG